MDSSWRKRTASWSIVSSGKAVLEDGTDCNSFGVVGGTVDEETKELNGMIFC